MQRFLDWLFSSVRSGLPASGGQVSRVSLQNRTEWPDERIQLIVDTFAETAARELSTTLRLSIGYVNDGSSNLITGLFRAATAGQPAHRIQVALARSLQNRRSYPLLRHYPGAPKAFLWTWEEALVWVLGHELGHLYEHVARQRWQRRHYDPDEEEIVAEQYANNALDRWRRHHAPAGCLPRLLHHLLR